MEETENKGSSNSNRTDLELIKGQEFGIEKCGNRRKNGLNSVLLPLLKSS